MSDDQEQETPAWHTIVGEGWEPVLLGEETKADEEELFAKGWVPQRDNGLFIYSDDMRPRRRRKQLYDVRTVRDGINFCYIKAAKPGDCFRLTDRGELVQFEVEE